jgi:NAD(P)H-nitrite reductase large subunit
LPADIVFAQDTYRPNIRCVRGSGIEVNKGILVDLELHTSAEHVYAAGDCVEIYHPALRNYWINFGWPNAVEQGTLAGGNMTGEHGAYRISDTLAFEILGKSFRARWWE